MEARISDLSRALVFYMFVILAHFEATSNNAALADQEPFILFGNRAFIHRMDLDGNEFTTVVSNEGANGIIGLDYDIRQEYMFWTDRNQKMIMRARLNGTEETTLVSSGLGIQDAIAWDWVNKKLYWTDAEFKRIEVFDPASGDRKELISTGENSLPRAIVVDPSTGWLYWTDWGSTPHIGRASMDGTNQTILHSTSLTWPNALTLDYENQVLYWADAMEDKIEYSNADGTGRTLLAVRENESIRHPFAITYYDNRLYWSDWGPDQIKSLSINNPETITAISEELSDDPTALHVVTAERQLARDNNPCDNNNGGCSNLCLLSAVAPEGFSCACPEGIELAPNQRRCLLPTSTPTVAVLPTPTPTIVQDLCTSVATTTVVTSLLHSMLTTTVYQMPSPTPTPETAMNDPCKQMDFCRNGGSCFSNSMSEYLCKCQEGYEGRNCENRKTDVCEASAPCKNGGSCVNALDGGYVCVCVPGYQGRDCESFFIDVNSTGELHACTESTEVSTTIFVGVIGGLILVIVLILLFGMTAFCTVVRKDHQKNLTYSVESTPQLLRRGIPPSCEHDYMSIKSCSPSPRAHLYTTVNHGTRSNGVNTSSGPPKENGVRASTASSGTDPLVTDNPAYDIQYKLQTL